LRTKPDSFDHRNASELHWRAEHANIVICLAEVGPKGIRGNTTFVCESLSGTHAGCGLLHRQQLTGYQFGNPFTVWNENGPAAHWRNRPRGAPFFAMYSFNLIHESALFLFGGLAGRNYTPAWGDRS